MMHNMTEVDINIITEIYKTCSKCHKILPATTEYFCKTKLNNDGLHYQCKNCEKEWRELHREHLMEYKKEYRRTHKEERREYQKKWAEENIETRREYKKNWNNERRKNYPQFRLQTSFSKAIWKALKKKGLSKNGYTWEKIIGYTIIDLMKHLEQQFTEGMNWDNYGKWHVDHIKPISLFTFTSYEDKEFKECWDLNNLQPLWAYDNLKKANKRIGDINGWK